MYISPPCIYLLHVYIFLCICSSICMSLRMYVPLCEDMSIYVNSSPYICPRHVCPSVCMFIHEYVPPWGTLPLRMRVPFVYVLSMCMSLYMHFSSWNIPPLCIFPLRVYISLYDC